MKVAVIAQDDAVAACLAPLQAHSCKVLGISVGNARCPIFTKHCVEMGFDCIASQDAEAVRLVVERFAPDMAICLPADIGTGPCSLFDQLSAKSKHKVCFGAAAPDAPWPEFVPIWHSWAESSVRLLDAQVPASSVEVQRVQVSLAPDETAISLRMKHVVATTSLIAQLLAGDVASKRRATSTEQSPAEAPVPTAVSVEWDDAKVDRFVRARSLPPHDPAQVADPNTGHEYFIENMAQYREFRKVMAAETKNGTDDKQGMYAADTHWYRITNDGLRKVGDASIHKPRRTKDGAFSLVIPGAAVKGAKKKLRLNEPFIGLHAERYCSSVLASTWLGVEGPFVKRFEAHLARICGCEAACAVHSGTAGCYGAMKALGVSGADHHVLVPAFTCAAAADAVVHAGGTPIPIDSEVDSYGISADAVRAALAKDPQVVGVVTAPCYGVPIRDFHEIRSICEQRGIWLCEDACESYGARVATPDKSGGTVPLGSLTTLTVISARSEKMIGVGEGGAILGNNISLVTKARWWCSRAPCRGGTLWRVYEHEGVGQNFRLPEMLGAVGCAAAEMFPLVCERKRRIHSWYEKHMVRPGLEGVRLQKATSGDEPVWWVNSAVLPAGDDAEGIGMQLMVDYPDIEIRPGFFPLDQMAIFRSAASEQIGACSNAAHLFKQLIVLPSSVHLQEADVGRICTALEATLKKTRAAATAVTSAA